MMCVHCQHCEKRATLTTGRNIYPHRPDLHGKKFYLCQDCQAWVGTHQTGKPLGTPANARLRNLRSQVHARFDPLWLCQKKHRRSKSRRRLYAWLAREMRLPETLCHIGMFDELTCERALKLLPAESVEETTR